MLTYDAITKYIPYVDEKYTYDSRTAVLDTAPAFQQYEDFSGAATIKLASVVTDGLVNYSRQNGFADGNVTVSWEEYTLTQDRSQSFMIDYVGNDEVDGVAVANAMSVFFRESVIPELDAYKFARYFANQGYEVADATLTKDTVVGAIADAEVEMADNAVPLNEAYLFVNPSIYNKIKNSGAWMRTLVPSENPNRNFGTYDDMQVIMVPKQRFYSAITLAASGNGGYAPASDAKEINFMIIHPAAVLQVVKHASMRLFDPTVNQKADAYKIDYRCVYDAFVLENKKAGIYGHARPQYKVTVSPTTATVAAGSTTSITATTVPSDATVTWSTSNSAVATVSSGTVTGVAAGKATITATITDSVDGVTKKATTVVTVTAS